MNEKTMIYLNFDELKKVWLKIDGEVLFMV
jgi:hypothetical protein